MSAVTPMPMRDFAFGHCRVQPSSRQLWVAGQPARLGARAFDILLVLVERRDRIVTKNELLELVWPGRVVEENNLQVHIWTLRKLLGPLAIATIPGRGYRFTVVLTGKAVNASASSTDAVGDGWPKLPPHDVFVHELPTLFGRELDLTALSQAVAMHRLATVVGSSGIGKTALAKAALQAMQATFADGACVVDLATLDDAAQIAPAVTSALNVTLGAGTAGAAFAREVMSRHAPSCSITASTCCCPWRCWQHSSCAGALVDKSLVAAESDARGEVSYRMLETMRHFALERSTESGEDSATGERHLAFCLALAERAHEPLAGPQQGVWLERLSVDRDNLLAALAWCAHAAHGAERGLRITVALERFWAQSRHDGPGSSGLRDRAGVTGR